MKYIKYMSALTVSIILCLQCTLNVTVFGEDANIKSHMPEYVLLSPGSGFLTFTWKNPSAADIEKISIYDITDNDEVLITNEINKTPSKYVLYQITGLTNNQYRQYKLVFEYSGYEDFTFYMCGMPTTNTRQNVEDISLLRSGGAEKMLPASITVDTKQKYSGNSSVKITSAFVKDTNYSNYTGKDWGYSAVLYKLPLIDGKKYTISYWARGLYMTSHASVHMGWAYFEEEGKAWAAKCSPTTQWQQYKHTYDYSGAYVTNAKNTLYFIYENTCDGFWIDDLEVYELDGDGNPVGDNLAVNGGFEIAGDDIAIDSASCTDSINSSVISWEIDENASYIGTNVYREQDGEYYYIGRFAKGLNTFVPENVIGGNSYNFKLAAVNELGVEGQPIEVTADPIVPPYETGELVLKYNSSIVSDLSSDGEYTAELQFRNNTLSDGLSAEMLVALSDEGGVLKKVLSSKTCVSVSEDFEPLKVDFSVTDNIKTVEVFIFDSRSTLNIIGETNSYKIFIKSKGED